MSIELLQVYARERRISVHEARQVLAQVLVLKHLSEPRARFMGGTALVLGYGNPRFSEDVDLTQVRTPRSLAPGLRRAAVELSAWLGVRVSVVEPKTGRRTHRLVGTISPSQSLSLHVDTQPFRGRTSRPLVVQFPSVPPFIIDALALDEILAEKILALAFRRYLGGRDLFDLWFHWLRHDAWRETAPAIGKLAQMKLKERDRCPEELELSLKARLRPSAALERARDEWRRYLPASFQKESVYREILVRGRFLLEAEPWRARST